MPKTPNGVVDFAVQVTQGGPQAITATANAGAGSPGIPGTVVLMKAIHASMGVNQSMFFVGANTLVKVPFSVGRAGQFTSSRREIGAQRRS